MSVYPNGGQQPAPFNGVNFDNIGQAWGLVRSQLGTWVGALLIVMLISGAVSSPLSFYNSYNSYDPGGPKPPTSGQALLGAINGLLSGAVGAFFAGGLWKMALKQIRGEAIGVGDVFTGGSTFLPVWGATLLIGLGTGVGTLFCIVPGLLLAALWQFTIPLIVEKGLGVTDALSASWRAAQPYMWSILGYVLVSGIIASLGVVLCFIGVVVTAPIATLSIALLYRDFFPEPGDSRFGLEMPLPPTAQ